MNESRISVRYARALFQSALDRNILDTVNQDILLVKELCSSPEIRELLANPVIPPSKKSLIFHDLIGSEVNGLTMSLIDLVIRNGRERYLPAIARVFIHDTREYKGITESVLTTAVKVDDGVRRQVSELIEKLFSTKVDLRENIDESIIGGFVLKIEDKYIDASVRNKLRKIRKELCSGSFQKGF
ncbi:MAG TPA: ATP synthase F1 subunit delta [Bacteroidales bacterium]|nr:ATP synthase F1 subunit delta [Bacteroidales bacterium]